MSQWINGAAICLFLVGLNAATADAGGGPFSVIESSTYTYLLYRPRDYPRGGPVPLMIFLHGKGDGSVAGVQHWGPPERVAHGVDFPFLLVAPICSDPWWNGAKLHVLLREIIATYTVDPDRVYLTGISMGGFATWDLALRAPELFAVVVPICGGGDPSHISRLRALPVWVYHGDKDPIVTEDHSAKMVAALRAAGGLVDYTVFPDAEHVCWPRVYNDPGFYERLLRVRRTNPGRRSAFKS
jgi:predicted peptidase